MLWIGFTGQQGFINRRGAGDDDAIRRARVYVDNPAAITEAGEICQPIANGILALSDIQGDLFSLAQGKAPRRQSSDEITLFKVIIAKKTCVNGIRIVWLVDS